MSHLDKIFAVWGDNAESLAADIGESGVTVRAWRNRDSIHSDHWPKIITAAFDKRDTLLRLEDFVPPDIVAQLPVRTVDHPGANQADGDGPASADAISHEADISRDLAGASATKVGENIREDCSASGGRGGAGDDAPFGAASPSTCSTTPAPSSGSPASPACSIGDSKVAA